jgi:HD-GYP domain-containing protein (c-di-GMP phosphodiesterase class II)
VTVIELSIRVAEKIRLDEDERHHVELAALFHDIGKLAIPQAIFSQPEPLTDEQWEIVRTHAVRGQELLEQAGLAEIGEIVRAIHERWDGTGYPDCLSGPSIPLAARIVSCCTAFNAMTTVQPYRLPMPQEAALRELVDNAGTQFDPHVVQTLIAVIRRSILPALPALRSADGDSRLDRAGARAS